MMIGKHRVIMVKRILLSIVMSVGVALQGNAETVISELESGTATASIEGILSAKDVIHDFMDSKEWIEGRNTKKDGSSFIIATGTGIIQAPRGHHAYIDGRQIAFDKALVDAKSSLLRYMESEVSTDIKKAAQEGEFPSLETPTKDLSVKEKMLMLAHATLDEKLKEKGVAFDDPEAEEVLKGVLNSEEFSKIVRSASESYIAGFQAYKTFESAPKDNMGRMGVILLWSHKLNEMATSIQSRRPINAGKAKRTLQEQVAVDEKVLLSTFGVQQTRDENGDYWLLASGQSGLKSDSAMSEDMAEEKARTIAEAYIRSFAGENAKRVTDMYQAESYKELITGAEIYEDKSATWTAFESHSKAMKISGMKVLRRWQTSHPLTKQRVVGVVLAWSPLSAQHAVSTSQAITDAHNNGIKKTSTGAVTDGSFGASGGFGGDDDDF
jgi:hypothetical protein